MVEAGKQSKITPQWVKKEIGIKNVYCGGAEDLVIKWVNEGTAFEIYEYDGAESIETVDDLTLIA
jgi:hypothetical protein